MRRRWLQRIRVSNALVGNLGRQPALGAVADRLLIEPGVLLAGTIRRDGTARISGVEPLLLDGDLWLSMMAVQPRAATWAAIRGSC